MSPLNPRQIEIIIRTRYCETDNMGVIHHCNYFHYVEEARMELFNRWGVPYNTIEAMGTYLVVTDTSCKYRSPAYFGDELSVVVSLQRASRYRLIYDFKISRIDQQVLAIGDTALAAVSHKGCPTPLPDRLWTRLIQLQLAEGRRNNAHC